MDGGRPMRRSLVYPRVRVDGPLASLARTHPDRPAMSSDSGELTFGEWDALVTACGAELARMLGEGDSVVAVTSPLKASFAIAYFAVIRSRNIVAPLNPFLREAELSHVLGTSGARLVFVTSAMYDRIQSVRDRLPRLEYVVFLDDPAGSPPMLSLQDLIARGSGSTPAPDDDGDEDLSQAVASLQFTSGTTGLPKTVVLSHRNLTTNAAQVAAAHQLDQHSVVLNYLPTFHPMHLLSATHAGAFQVLCASPEVADSIDAANRCRATHYYSLPVRLGSLARNPRLSDLTLTTVRVIASGGSALPPSAAETLMEHFGVPVIQGYGLAETSPLTHSDQPPQPRLGSVGRAVADTECRIVDVTSREVLDPNEHGEVQVRGPQLMKGYLGDASGSGIDAEGWFSTGDIGYLDRDGYLFLIDRLKDLFKFENWLVSPAQTERALGAHPGVKECAVFDYPDALKGAVAYALVVLNGSEGGGEEARTIAESVNSRLPYYQRLTYVEAVTSIPRSANGKIQRKDLRAAAVRAGLTAAIQPSGAPGSSTDDQASAEDLA